MMPTYVVVIMTFLGPFVCSTCTTMTVSPIVAVPKQNETSAKTDWLLTPTGSISVYPGTPFVNVSYV